MSARTTTGQVWRFAAVGIASNVALYLLYLLLTRLGLPSKLAVTLLWGVGVTQTFVFNRQWSFRSGGAARPEFRRYCVAYALGYVFNMAALFLAVDVLGWPHEVAQGILILVTAVLLFLLQKFWVFRPSSPPPTASLPTP